MPLLRIFLKRLYVRIWAAVVLAIVVLSLLSAWVMRVTREPPLREVVIRSQDGMILGQGRVRLSNGDRASSSGVGPNNAQAPAEQNTIALNIQEKGQIQDPQLYAQRREGNSSAEDVMAFQRFEPPELHDSPSSSPLPVQGVYGPGPEFLVTLSDG